MSVRSKLAKKSSKLNKAMKPVDNHPADLTGYKDRDYTIIPIDMIHPDPNQPRIQFDEEALSELSETIRQNGVLQPVIVRKDAGNKIWLIAGERRYRASRLAGLTEMPAIISKGNPAEIALIENIQRENLKPVEEAEAFRRMMAEHDYTQEQLSKVIGKARSSVTETLSLCKLPDIIKQKSAQSDVSKRTLVAIAKKESEEEMLHLFDQAEKGLINSNDLRKRKRKKRVVAPKAQVVMKKIEGLSTSLSKLDTKAMDDSERDELFEKLDALSLLIQEIKQ